MEEIADQLGIPVSRVYGVATFHTLLATEPKGKHIIRVCESPPCHIRGAVNILETLQEVLGLALAKQRKIKNSPWSLPVVLGSAASLPR